MELIIKSRLADHEEESLRLFAQYYRHLLKRHWKRLCIRFFIAFLIIVLGVYHLRTENLGMPISACILVLLYLWLILYQFVFRPKKFARNLLKSLKTAPGCNDLTIITINDDRIEYKGGDGDEGKLSWKKFTNLISFKDGFVLMTGDRPGLFLNRSVFTKETEEAFLNLVREKNILLRS